MKLALSAPGPASHPAVLGWGMMKRIGAAGLTALATVLGLLGAAQAQGGPVPQLRPPPGSR
ncbi:hypothetical protein MSS93_14030 [Deinococcus radiodurans]|nr:hypothetical protein MSS93_14030 [Deinococcus radiodurans]